MKNGSLVECIDNTRYEDLVKLNTPYTVDEIVPTGTHLYYGRNTIFVTGEDGLYLKGVDRYNKDVHGDIPFPLKDFRELMPNLKDALEEIFELQLI